MANLIDFLKSIRPTQSRMICRAGRRHRAAATTHEPSSRSVELLESRQLLTFTIQWDYSLDSSGFFNDPDRRAIMDQVATDFESRIEDSLTAIVPGGVNSWTARISDPSTGSNRNISNLTIPEDTVVIYVGARDLPSGLGLGGFGGFSSSGTSDFNQNLESRGQAGVISGSNNDTDFGPWGGSISFDSLVNWHFGLTPPSSGENDFYSVALHETAHVLGFGTAESFERLINGANNFVGTNSVAAYGQPVPMSPAPDNAHWQSGIMGQLPGTSINQEVALDPAITTGTRKLLTNVDWGALEDIGWEITPVAGPIDYGDALDATDGFGAGEYQTRVGDNGPRHAITSSLYIGNTAPDADPGTLNNENADADNTSGTADEGFTGSDTLTAIAGISQTYSINVTNQTDNNATLYGWIDFDGDGEFELSERASAVVTGNADEQTVNLTFAATSAATDLAPFDSVMRLRLSTDVAAASAVGPAIDGEVEDHLIRVYGQEFAYDSLPRFTWPADATAQYYELEVNNLSTGQDQVILQSRLFETSFRPAEALPAGRYSWRYRPHNGTSFGPYSPTQTFDIFETSSTPLITDPFQSASDAGVESLPTIAWSPYENAARYQLWVNDVTNNISRLVYQTNLTETSWIPETAFAAGQYRAFVRAIDGTGLASPWSAPFDFTVASSAANAGEVTSPVGASTNAAPTIAFRPTSGTNRLVITNVDTAAVVVNVDRLSELSYTVPTGLPAGLYEAQLFVNGSDASGESQRFEILPVTGQIAVTNIRTQTENTAPVIGWNDVSGADRYSIWINNTSKGITQAYHSVTETGTAFQPVGLISGDTYRVWVRAFSGFSPLTAWSTPVDFTIGESTAIPKIYSPVAETENTAPVVSWATVTGAAEYEVQISQAETAVQSYRSFTSNQPLESPLAAGHYTVTVTAKDGGGTELGSDEMNFTVEPGDLSIELFGTDGALSNPRPEFSWSAVPGATRYVIWVNDDTNGLTATVFDSELTSTTYTPGVSLLPGRHRVWVRAFNESIALTAWSSPSSFQVLERSGAPEIVRTPVRLGQTSATTTNPVPAITWTPVAGAASYELQVRDSTSGNLLQSLSGLTTTIARPELSAGTYDFQVRSLDSIGTPSALSSAYRLRVVSSDPALASQLTLPLVRSTIGGTDVLFGWTFPATSGITYDLWVSNLTLGTRPVFEQGLSDQTYTAASLPAGKYRAWVRAIGTGVNSNWSIGVDFTVASNDAAVENLLDLNFENQVLMTSTMPLSTMRLSTQHHSDVAEERNQELPEPNQASDAGIVPAAILHEVDQSDLLKKETSDLTVSNEFQQTSLSVLDQLMQQLCAEGF